MKKSRRDGAILCGIIDGVPLSYAERTVLTAGELYLFHPTQRCCPVGSSLWGVFDKRIGADIYLESSSRDLFGFRYWHRLPRKYRYCRLSTRDELRDYAVAEIYERLMSCNGKDDPPTVGRGMCQ